MLSCISANLMLPSASSDVIGGVCYVQHKHRVMCYNIRSSKNSISCSCFFIGCCTVSAKFQHYIFFYFGKFLNTSAVTVATVNTFKYLPVWEKKKHCHYWESKILWRSWTEVHAFKAATCSFTSRWQRKLTITQRVQCVCSVCVSALWPDSSQQL